VKVFVSHSFADEDLASFLVKVLKEKDIDGYMAQRRPDYEQFIHQKIRAEISASDYLVAILTTDALKSASVNQEIGFALCRDIPIIIMKEKEAKLGVLTHGREPEEFTKDDFNQHCIVIRDYLLTRGVPRKRNSDVKTSEAFLLKRRLVDVDGEAFAINDYTRELADYSGAPPGSDIKPFVLFFACPRQLAEVEVNSPSVSAWIKSNNEVLIHEKHVRAPFLKSYRPQIDLESIIFRSKHGDNHVDGYLEINQNGSVSQGITYPLIYKVGTRNQTSFTGLHLTFLMGAWWTFLTFCRDYYSKINLDNEIDLILAVHNGKALNLYGFGGKINDKGTHWADPTDSMWWHQPLPSTTRTNIALKESLRPSEMTEETLAKLVRKFADRMANAYQLETAMCYHFDGTFDFSLFLHYDP
jgi:nucleoside 2-deoxyribosyltransferase